MKNHGIEIRRVPVDEVIDLRHRILRSGLGREAAFFDGDDLPDTVHFAAYRNDSVVGCATVLVNQWEQKRACQLRGMAVNPELQKSGVGRLLLDEVEQLVREQGIDLIWANCRTPAAGFYHKLGWEAVSDEFVIPTAGPHYKMIKKLVNL